jgi:cell division protein FtsB
LEEYLMNERLERIDFGQDTAEFDKHLADYFLETPTYTQVMRGEKAIVTGRKGTGKTALLRYAVDTERPATQYVLKIEASHATYAKLDENLRALTSQIKNLDSSFKLAWLFTTLLALIDRLTRETTLYVTDDEKALYAFAKENYRYTEADPVAAIAGYVFSWVKNLKTIGPIERDVPGSPGTHVFDEPRLLELIRGAVTRVTGKGKTVFLFYDRLDERWDGSPLYAAFLQGLLLAVKDLKALGLDLHPVILLRDDIFSVVTREFQHIDHFRMHIAALFWDERALLDLIALRIRSSLTRQGHRIPPDPKAEDMWRIPFPKDIPARKTPISPWAYMIERTLFRPRDIVLFANLARDAALSKRHAAIEPEDVTEAEAKYSNMKLHDLVAEVSYKYPGVDGVLKSFKRGTVGYGIDDLRYRLMELRDAHRQSAPWVDVEEDDLMRTLYSIGFLSYTTRGGSLRGTRVVHSAVNSDPDIILEQDRIYISPIFRGGLELRDH